MSSQKTWVARAVKDLCKRYDSPLLRTEMLSDYSAASFSNESLAKNQRDYIIGFDTAGDGHKRFDLAVKTERGTPTSSYWPSVSSPCQAQCFADGGGVEAG